MLCRSLQSVSYTHLDVYKRQVINNTLKPLRLRGHTARGDNCTHEHDDEFVLPTLTANCTWLSLSTVLI